MLIELLKSKSLVIFLNILFWFVIAQPELAHALEYKGRVNTWALYLTDDFSSNTVWEVYQNASCDNPGELLKLVIGRDRSQITECATQCCQSRTLVDGETSVERKIENPDQPGQVLATDSNSIGDLMIWNLGADANVQEKKWLGKIKGNFRTSLLNDRALYGTKRYRFLFSDLFGEYKDLSGKNAYAVRFGRQAINAGVIVDGVSSQYFWGPKENKEDRSIGLFAGLAPEPITKDPSLDFTTFGANFHFTPDWSRTSETKLRVDATLVAELYKGNFNRFYLFSRSHFTPVKKLSFLHYSTLELPGPSGDDKGLGSSHFSLQSLYRPNREWFFSFGFSQFRIDRYLVKESVQWLTDEGSFQRARIGDTLDRSHRYRFDFRTSYRPIEMIQPFAKLRFERRTFDSDKTVLNTNPATPDEPAQENLRLLEKKNAYGGSLGFRLFPIPRLETETEFAYHQRYLSKYWQIYQAATWDSGRNWTADLYVQMVSSERQIENSIAGSPAQDVKATDYYVGIGGSYKILSDLLAQVRYDFSCEEDYALGNSITIHSILARFDYRF